jgi:Uma2 family endonuclease
MLEPMLSPLPHNIRGLKRVEYDALVEAGLFEGAKIELLEGQLVDRVSPTSTQHSGLAMRIADALRDVIPREMTVAMHQPFAATEDSEPEPDVAVVTRAVAHSRDVHADSAFLLVEVCYSSQHNDRVIKTRIYARAGVPEYWIVDVVGEQIEIYTQPRNGQYQQQRIVTNGLVTPVAIPAAQIDIAALFR